MTDISVRLAYKEDIAAMYNVEKTSFPCPWSYDSFAENFYNLYSIYVLAENSDGVIGFGGMQVIFDEAHIMNVAVLKNYRRNGAASQMLELMMNEAKSRGAEKIFLEVRKSNLPAQALYRKHGFNMLAIREKYYSDNNEDAIIMAAEL